MQLNIFKSFLNLLFGCRHKHYSFPMSPKAEGHLRSAAKRGRPYVVCLDCARQFPYDWEQMRVVWTPITPTASAGAARELPSSILSDWRDKVFDFCQRLFGFEHV